ncbi:uncharacterized protein BXZ73DRAFT_104161 [Epithele typhae]|uniref:uncharacterized protein n=1 Tax=Epithele typhae TaxID=378194 RepID=UPI002008634B|nr:uncharacterized protein BXZ73DRAFT_104161 [Epithele typhae]KAH9922343.1 hypothetical protein BXZ73DRAFT_104161 [Epithele typhae]
MQFPLFLTAVVACFASQVLALNMTFPAPIGLIQASDFLNSADPARTDCSTDCNLAQGTITACGSDDLCLCNDTMLTSIMSCETCMFQQLIADNRLPTDERTGLVSAITLYTGACTGVNHTSNLSAVALTPVLPANWDGPFGQGLNPALTAVSVIAATILGVGLITTVNTM